MVSKSIFTGKKIKLLKPQIKNIILNDSGELKNGEGNILEHGEDYILEEDEHNDAFTRVYSNQGILIHQFEIKA